MMTFHAGSTQVIRGITDELVRRLVKKGLSPGHTVDSTGYTYTVTPFDAEGFTEVADIIASVLLPQHDIAALRERVNKLCDKYPLYVGSESW